MKMGVNIKELSRKENSRTLELSLMNLVKLSIGEFGRMEFLFKKIYDSSFYKINDIIFLLIEQIVKINRKSAKR
jgi:hypothetical protein